MKLKVEQIGNPNYPRYGIVCENGVWWTSNGWCPDKTKASLYASLAAARDDWKRLQAEMETGLHVLQATIVVTIKGVESLTREQTKQLATFLADASSFTLDYTKPRPKWLEKGVISTQIHWHLRPKK